MTTTTRIVLAGAALLVALAAPLRAPIARAQAANAPPAAGAPLPDDAPDQTPQGDITVPEDAKLFAANNPNVRRATALVNGDIITGTDVDQRLALILAANEGKIGDDEKARLRLQVLRNLIDETLQIQEAKAADVTVADDDVKQAYARVATQNFKGDVAALDAYLARVGSSPASLKRQIRGELAWQQVLRRNVAPFINVSNDEVNEILDRMKANKGSEEYRIGEIYLAATPDSQQQVLDNAKRIVDELQKGGSFLAYARQYSQASTAAVGGDLGWIRLEQLPSELAAAARNLDRGQLVGPVQVPGGFSILYMMDKRQVLTADPRDAVLALKQVSIAFPNGTNEADATRQAKAFAQAMSQAKGCGGVDAVAAGVGATVVANDQVRARDLPGPLQEAVLKLSIGETSPPFGSIKDGVRVLMLCGRDDPPAANGPNFDDLMSQLEDDRINKRAQIYLRDLRRDAVIEYD